MDFTAAVNLHLTTIGKRDLDGYLSTVHDEVSLIMPNGKLLSGREEVAAFHRGWFDDPDWSWELDLQRSTTAGDTGVAIFAVDYHDLDGNGQPYELSYLLTLVFVRNGDTWLLLHDQNTPR
ncbi:YybH family protein [Actinoplanes friuliensis]|uniref:SnoaL-like domain-containing protein n=1 Tax=Actinoplanes friuliensis DSM 7358 TaxID=1246995 RepID=U5VZ09_9ACTN|nr:nuclear transport factor 2 family protein [Actinoplanes friuliensis]AGZ42208.1 hypothetical protein AFR_19680 [Actinoplanes friuliensis DSM 7358]